MVKEAAPHQIKSQSKKRMQVVTFHRKEGGTKAMFWISGLVENKEGNGEGAGQP